ncbi:endonuclease/exonuclease/phosphatase family protein [Asanoa sp. WMMD1127]|uniref:endonuclease/exonuclease/phosphatase family protein n=1 Tax=Asanoa sp. WMMD1127 TaxID=3016107 RepID=UPI002416A5E3|nr:endonuclease/exonuclease/phosphatase family protein [Asanoa sp. WMMD1127]MDG4825523.1 endonuclease/exonuclease/phosphatase family protein [Asanoa sp. WMMD1127]
MTQLRVLSLNLWARHGDWDRRRDVLAAGLRELSPDLVAAQEAIVDDAGDQLADLLDNGYQVVHQTRGLVGDGRHHGVSIASRWPVERVHEVDLHLTPRTGAYSCGTLLVEVRAPAPLGRVVLVDHGPSWPWWAEAERELQAVAAARAIEEFVGDGPAHVVVGGDFNAEPETASMRFWSGRQSLDGLSVAYRDAWESCRGGAHGWTFDPRNPLTAVDEPGLDRGRRIDYVLVRCGDHGPSLAVRDVGLAFNQPVGGVWATDHFGVYADLAAVDL